MSNCWVGSTHDFRMLKEDFPTHKHWFKNHNVLLDLGYVGFSKDYPCKNLSIPQKKPRNGGLSEPEKAKNRQKARERVTVEHSLCGLKRYRILVNRMRMKDIDLYNDIIEVCAGLWNFYLSH